MKKMLNSIRSLAFCGVLFFIASFVFATEANAQSSTWKAPSEAKVVLATQLQSWKQVMIASVPGSPAHTNALNHIDYYSAVLKLINAGWAVEKSAVVGLSEVAPVSGMIAAPTSSLPKGDLENLFTEAENVLTD